MRIRYFPAKFKHISELDEINRNSLPENYSTEFWAEVLAQHRSLVASHDGKIVGYILIGILDDKLTVVSFAVCNEYRSNGIGTELLKKGIDAIRKSDKKNIYLTVRDSNIRARNLYRVAGFTDIKSLPNYYTNPEEDGIEMSLFTFSKSR